MSESVNDGEMSLRGHLSEMRNRIIRVMVFFLIGFIAGFYGASIIVDCLTSMGTKYGYSFVYIAPQELLMVYFSVAFIAALVIRVFTIRKGQLSNLHLCLVRSVFAWE